MMFWKNFGDRLCKFSNNLLIFEQICMFVTQQFAEFIIKST